MPTAIDDAPRRMELIGTIAEDLARERPRLIYIKRHPSFVEHTDFDLAIWLGEDRRMEEVLSDYTRDDSGSDFVLWRRREP